MAGSVAGISRAAGVANCVAGIYLFIYGLVGNLTASKTFDRPFYLRVGGLLATTAVLVIGGWFFYNVRKFGSVFAVLYVPAISIRIAEVYASKETLAVAQLVGLTVVLVLTAVAFYRLSDHFETPPARTPGARGSGGEA